MRRTCSLVLIFGCLLALIVICFGPALFRGRQFAYRDAAHYYYPLYERVQKEWEAGRWPLWEPEENGGMPLLGNPTAAVLYPGKVIYSLVPYAWGARLYVVAHTVLAFAGMLALLRSWGTSWTGAAIGGLGYAFGAPVLFQYCNIIYLVGAAWLPFGLRAADRWLRLGRRWALIELALVLALETLGGDPESAYVTGLCAGGYALGLAWMRGRPEGARARSWPWVLLAIAAVAIGTVATLAVARWAPHFRPGTLKPPPRALPGMAYVPVVVALIWLSAGLIVLGRRRRRGRSSPLVAMLAGLAGSAVLAGGLSAAQLLPVVEFTRLSGRAAEEGTHDIYPFSLEPTRLVEFLWPNAFGTHFHGNRNWLNALPPSERHAKVWVPSLYLGGLTLILGLGGLGVRHGPPWRVWLSVIALVSLVGALGEYTSPLYWARFSPRIRAQVGPHDPPDVTAIRLDRHLRDGDGSVYWALATALPGFKQFRFPSKLLTFTAFALAALAGLEWDRVAGRRSGPSPSGEGGPQDRVRERLPGPGPTGALPHPAAAQPPSPEGEGGNVWAGRSGRAGGLAALAFLLCLFLTLMGFIFQGPLVEVLQARAVNLGSPFGPLDVAAAVAESRQSLLHATVVMAIVLFLCIKARRAPAWAGAVALVVLSADLALANSKCVLTVPQSLFETEPEVVRLLKEAERARPSDGPFRVHRVPIWEPLGWRQEATSDRVRDFVAWERRTIQPKYGLSYGIEYTRTLGVAELYDYEWFFGPFLRGARPEIARQLGVKPGAEVVVYPRHGFDLWNTRYFVLPYFGGNWKEEHRGFASFLPETERLFPAQDAFSGPDGREREKEWIERHDFQIRRNKAAFPRAWVVHDARYLRPMNGLDRESRDAPMLEILYGDDPLWSDPTRVVYDASKLAWVDLDKRRELAPFLPSMDPAPSESVRVTSDGPRRVELAADLKWPGLVVLADIYYPGWTLAIDGVSAPVYRANRMMRGAAVPAGKHRLVFTYEPRSFRFGLQVSVAALFATAGLAGWFVRRPAASDLLGT